jgi:hypothetical protein
MFFTPKPIRPSCARYRNALVIGGSNGLLVFLGPAALLHLFVLLLLRVAQDRVDLAIAILGLIP